MGKQLQVPALLDSYQGVGLMSSSWLLQLSVHQSRVGAHLTRYARQSIGMQEESMFCNINK